MCRGMFGACTQFATVMGILIAAVFAFPLAKPQLWRYMFAFTPALRYTVDVCSGVAWCGVAKCVVAAV